MIDVFSNLVGRAATAVERVSGFYDFINQQLRGHKQCGGSRDQERRGFVRPGHYQALELLWDRPADTNLRGYEIHRDGEYHAFTSGVSFLDTVSESNRVYRYDIVPISRTDAGFQGFSSIDVELGEADAGECR